MLCNINRYGPALVHILNDLKKFNKISAIGTCFLLTLFFSLGVQVKITHKYLYRSFWTSYSLLLLLNKQQTRISRYVIMSVSFCRNTNHAKLKLKMYLKLQTWNGNWSERSDTSDIRLKGLKALNRTIIAIVAVNALDILQIRL